MRKGFFFNQKINVLTLTLKVNNLFDDKTPTQFGNSFSDADVLCVMDIYPAGEKPIEGVNADAVVKAIKDNGHKDVVSFIDRSVLTETIMKRLRPHDLFLTIGAGDVWKTGEALLKRMKSEG